MVKASWARRRAVVAGAASYRSIREQPRRNKEGSCASSMRRGHSTHQLEDADKPASNAAVAASQGVAAHGGAVRCGRC
ncbi:conserved hypothetical protein [Ricinus communis]|uniref:Uncharacterized protein n=1 Tax=Ricinus communis TaxID=3988 RepID=B9T779_RICCO|nr:conserved hypothetical protein [Ricinus communis]